MNGVIKPIKPISDTAFEGYRRTSRWLHLQGAVGEIRTEKFMGRDHVVVPVVMLMEGVVWPVTADAPEFVPAGVLAVAPSSWDGSPVLTNHPALDGERVNGNHPRILESMQFGTVFGTHMESKSMVCESWLDPARAEELGPSATEYLERLQDKDDQIEVSIGALVVTIEKSGEYRGQPYEAVWKEVYRDHLAFLPKGTEGACNAEMGCGANRMAMRHLVTAQGMVKERSNGRQALGRRAPAQLWRRLVIAHALSKSKGSSSDSGRR